jgi:protein SCO1
MSKVSSPFDPRRTAPRKLLSAVAVWVALFSVCQAQAAAGLPASVQPARADQFARNFDGAQLTDARGQRFDPQALTGLVVLYHFMFTTCSTVCPTQTAELKRVLDRMTPEARQRVRIVSISVDPLSDTPAALSAYARRMGSDRPGWHFVSPRPADITRLSDRLRLQPTGAQPSPAAHTTALWVVDAAGRLRMRYDGAQPDVPRLVRELTLLATLPAPPLTRPGT